MKTCKTPRATFAFLSALVLMLTLISVLPLSPQPAAAQTMDCGGPAASTVQIKYDDNEPYEQMTDVMGQCALCTVFQGVLFTLPGGVSSSILKKVTFYAGGGKDNHKGKVLVHFYSTEPRKLAAPISVNITEANWYTVSVPDIAVPSRFYVLVERLDDWVMPYYDIKRQGPSCMGEKVGELGQGGFPPGDFLIRASVVPEARVGVGQDYTTIQEAINKLDEGWTILVADGTYHENVTIWKPLSIRSVNGPSKTTIRTDVAARSTVTVTSPNVILSGFTIKHVKDVGGSGVSLDNAGCSVISGNVITDNYYGIYVSENSTKNILLENECTRNTNGIYVDGSGNYINGNNLHGNTAPIGSDLLLSDSASGNILRFNTITLDPGELPASEVCNLNSLEEVSATHNWWGTETGPSSSGGQGASAEGKVDVDPWLNVPPLRVRTEGTDSGVYTTNSKSETASELVKSGSGTPVICIASFSENPVLSVSASSGKTVGQLPGKDIGKWIDALLIGGDDVGKVEVRVYYEQSDVLGLDEGALRLSWWNGEKWSVCSKSGVDKDSRYVWATLEYNSKPALSDLTGTYFAPGIPPGGGFSWWMIPLIIVIVIVLLIVFRILWVLLVTRRRFEV